MKKTFSYLFAVVVALAAFPAQAIDLTFTGDTTSGATYNRVTESLSDLSFFGSAVHFNLISITLPKTDLYTFTLVSNESNPLLFDTFLSLYSTFDSVNPLDNILAANDNLSVSDPANTALGSRIVTSLDAGTYALVVSGFSNEDYGTYTVTAVPEASTVGFYAVALAGAVLLIVRKRRVA